MGDLIVDPTAVPHRIEVIGAGGHCHALNERTAENGKRIMAVKSPILSQGRASARSLLGSRSKERSLFPELLFVYTRGRRQCVIK